MYPYADMFVVGRVYIFFCLAHEGRIHCDGEDGAQKSTVYMNIVRSGNLLQFLGGVGGRSMYRHREAHS